MFRDFLDILHRNGLLVDIIAIKILINCIVVSVFMILYRGATGTKLGDLWQFLSSILIISVISYCVVEFFLWSLFLTSSDNSLCSSISLASLSSSSPCSFTSLDLLSISIRFLLFKALSI